jgi:hypothetical protein
MYVYNPSNFSVNYANGAGTSNQLTGGVGSWGGNTDFNSIRIQNRTIFREMLGTNRTAPNWPATPLQRASGSGAYNYGSVLSASGDYAHFEIYIPNNTSNIVHPEFVPYLRTGYQGGWSNWSRFVMSVDDTTTLTGSDGVALVVDSQVTYGQRSSAIVEMNGQSDNWASSSYRLNTKSEDNLGCEWLFEKFTVDEGWRTLGFVNRNNDDNLMWMGDILWNASDERLKTNISTMTGALESVKQIRPVTYEWDPEMQEHHRREGSDIGFIAQELEEILPEVVVTRPDGYKVIKYEKVVPLLLGAIKDQQALIESLMSRVEALENK